MYIYIYMYMYRKEKNKTHQTNLGNINKQKHDF